MKKHTIAILAFNSHDLTMKVVDQTFKNNPESDILIFDNGSEPSYKKLINKYSNEIHYHREKENIYVNAAWNKIFDQVKTPYLTLLNNDCFVLSKNYFSSAINYMENNKIILSSCKTISFKTLKFLNFSNYLNIFLSSKKINFIENSRRQGWLMTINLDEYKKLDYKIPSYLKVWFGDDWIWYQVRNNKKIAGVFKNYLCGHIKSSSTLNPNIKTIIDQDISAINKYGGWYKKSADLIHQYRCKALKIKHI